MGNSWGRNFNLICAERILFRCWWSWSVGKTVGRQRNLAVFLQRSEICLCRRCCGQPETWTWLSRMSSLPIVLCAGLFPWLLDTDWQRHMQRPSKLWTVAQTTADLCRLSVRFGHQRTDWVWRTSGNSCCKGSSDFWKSTTDSDTFSCALCILQQSLSPEIYAQIQRELE